jgi:hypothetical protein
LSVPSFEVRCIFPVFFLLYVLGMLEFSSQFGSVFKLHITTLVPRLCLKARCLIIFILFCHLGMFSNKKNYNLQLVIILNNEAIMLESFIQIFGMAGTYFSEILAIPKIK